MKILFALTLLSLTACSIEQIQALSPTKTVMVTGAAFPRNQSGFLEYANSLDDLTDAELGEELAFARGQFRQQADVHNRMRLALLLMHQSSLTENYQEAEQLLSEYLESPQQGSIRDFYQEYTPLASFLLATVRALHEREKENRSLRHTLDQLKAIEKQMNLPGDDVNGANN